MIKVAKRVGLLVLMVVIAYNSIYFKSLKEVKSQSSEFDGAAYAAKFFQNTLLPMSDSAMSLSQLLALVKQNKEETFNTYAHSLSIGAIKYFLVKGTGKVTVVNENELLVKLDADSTGTQVKVATEFVFGNAIRDASGKIELKEFSNLSDVNSISSALNEIVRTKVLPPFNKTVKAGDQIQFYGALELNKERLNLDEVELMPIQLQVVK